ncbi:hypothetical protein A1O7_04210 [Cladophialophora yegresii CBS 114405]|uniref:Uncharacterized protein n=1 Tax=Cladophialophora yegresii CBS 114405 TaxID=1182544 RepID=W9W6A7_9EURO|nr:uncharacterized protein A1O7_04210 [Cladophialophora yegresii CBS 114405]EXJ60061.1 hypothetical protein A1O7_04210 [Cladophialophora yegresii CBS 114405]
MGNAQSQEGDSADLATQAGTEDREYALSVAEDREVIELTVPLVEFDLSKISDDRDASEQPTTSHVEPDRGVSDASPNEVRRTDSPKPQKRARRKKQTADKQAGRKRSERKARRSPNNTSNEAASDVLVRESQPAPESLDPTEEDRPLKETEPETYHIYATSDESDVEDGDHRMTGRVINGFKAVNGLGHHDLPEVQDGSADDSGSDQEDAAQASAQTSDPDSAVEALNLLASVAVTEPLATGPPTEGTTKLPPPSQTSEGRYLCPWFDSQGCTQTFAQKQGAIRHAKLPHATTTVETFAQAPTTQTTTAAQTQATQSTDPSQNAEVPPPKVTSEGRYTCPWVDVYECDLTFAQRKGAMRHANIHTKRFTCAVCNKAMSRQDSLLTHMKQHSALEIAAATNADGEMTQKEDTLGQQSNELPEEVDDEAEEPQQDVSDDVSGEFATPEVTPRSDEDAQRSSVESLPQDVQEVGDTVMQDAEIIGDAANEVSDRQSTEPSSIFEEEETRAKQTPITMGKLKRKRIVEDAQGVSRQSPKRAKRRKKTSWSTPPTSIPSIEPARPETPKGSAVETAARSRQITDKIVPRLQNRQGSMDDWAQKFTPGSNLKHPTLNPTPPRPRTQQTEVVIPHTSHAGPSGLKQRRTRAPPSDEAMVVGDEDVGADSFTKFRHKKSRKTMYATPKGKKRAEPDVEYSTPAKEATVNEGERSEADVSDTDGMSPVDIATSVAKRTFPGRDQAPTGDDHQDSEFEVTRAPESDNESIQTARPAALAKKARKSTGTKKTERQNPANTVECLRCHRVFASQDQLRRHQKKRSAHIGLVKCHDCSEEFYATAALIRHEKDAGHGRGNGLQGRIGAFSQDEVNKLNKWRDTFCEYHNISRTEFNDMMTGTLERGKGSSWSWAFVKRAEFLKEYLDVLPDRNKRSMLRYRERNFQNVEGMKNWSAEDDKELIRLQKELGTKWVEIARRLGRNADAVSQRWRHKLQYGEVETGEWSKAERDKFAEILGEFVTDADGNELEQTQIPWNKVSEKMGSRSAQQCSNHYRALHAKKEHGRWVRVDALEKTPGSSRILKTSKMALRLSGELRGRRTPKKGLSEEFIREDDDGDDEAEPAEEDPEDEHAQDDSSDAQEAESEAEDEEEENSRSASEEYTSPAPVSRKRNPLPTKTPSKPMRSSQLFEQTQTNTSALKPSQTSSRRKSGQPSQDRQSPNIPIQRRHISSKPPLEEIRTLDNGQLDDDVEDESEDGDEDARKRKSSQELGIVTDTDVDEAGNESEAEGDEEVPQESLPEDSADDLENEVTRTESDEETPDEDAEASDDEQAVPYESDGERVAKSDSNAGDLVDNGAEAEDTEGSADTDEDVQDSDDRDAQSASEDESVPESEEEDDSQEDVPAAEAEPPASSFMASINESAKRANIKKVRSSSQNHGQTILGSATPRRHNRRDIWQRESDEDSD